MEKVAKAIGYIVYAVASADKEVTAEEKKTIHTLVNEHWNLLADQEDPFGVRALDFIDKMLEVLEKERIESDFALEQFEETYLESKELFSAELKQFIIDICIQTANAFNRMNKSELVLLSRIENFMKEAN